MIDDKFVICVMMFGMLILLVTALMKWNLYKFNKKCDLKIKHLRLKERYEMLKRLTR